MPDSHIKLLVSEVDSILAKLSENVRRGLSSPKTIEQLHAQLELRKSGAGARLAELLKEPSFLPNPDLMTVFIDTAQPLDPDTIAIWLVERAVDIGASPAVAELASYSTTKTFVAREVIVLDGVRVREGVELASSIRLERLTSLQRTSFRDQFSENPTPWAAPRERAALVRTFDHPVISMRPDDRIPDNILAIAQDKRLGDVARLFTLLQGVAPFVWHDGGSTTLQSQLASRQQARTSQVALKPAFFLLRLMRMQHSYFGTGSRLLG